LLKLDELSFSCDEKIEWEALEGDF